MPSYTRKHFKDIAKIILKLPIEQRKMVAIDFSNLFSIENKYFNRDMFMKECGL